MRKKAAILTVAIFLHLFSGLSSHLKAFELKRWRIKDKWTINNIIIAGSLISITGATGWFYAKQKLKQIYDKLKSKEISFEEYEDLIKDPTILKYISSGIFLIGVITTTYSLICKYSLEGTEKRIETKKKLELKHNKTEAIKRASILAMIKRYKTKEGSQLASQTAIIPKYNKAFASTMISWLKDSHSIRHKYLYTDQRNYREKLIKAEKLTNSAINFLNEYKKEKRFDTEEADEFFGDLFEEKEEREWIMGTAEKFEVLFKALP